MLTVGQNMKPKPHGREIWRWEESSDMAQCRRLKEFFLLRQPSHMASLAQSQNQSCKTITMMGEMCGQLELEWLYCHSENWASQMAWRDPDRNSTAGRWTLALFYLCRSHSAPLCPHHTRLLLCFRVVHFEHLCVFDDADSSVWNDHLI